MKLLLLLIFLLSALTARENPFEALYDVPKVEEDIIPLLNIKTNQAFKVEQNITLINDNNLTIKSDANLSDQNKSMKVTENNTTIIKTTTPVIKTKKKVHKKKKIAKYKTIYQNYFLKVQHRYKSFKILTHDRLLKQTKFSHPKRVAFDFKRLQYFHTKNVILKSASAKKVKFGTHHNFYRITVELNKYSRYKITKKSYGYLLSFY